MERANLAPCGTDRIRNIKARRSLVLTRDRKSSFLRYLTALPLLNDALIRAAEEGDNQNRTCSDAGLHTFRRWSVYSQKEFGLYASFIVSHLLSPN